MEDDQLILVDAPAPSQLVEFECRTAADVAGRSEMVVRGAPAIGQAAAYGLAMTARRMAGTKPYARRATLRGGANALSGARPPAVNLRWAVDRMLARLDAVNDLNDDGTVIADALRAEADAICFEATRDHGLLAEHGLALLPDQLDRPIRVLTHCNTGPLACGQFGTALGVVGRRRRREIRPRRRDPAVPPGARLARSSRRRACPHDPPDVAAGALSPPARSTRSGRERTDRRDTANKIGTYPLAVLAAPRRPVLRVPRSAQWTETADGSGRSSAARRGPQLGGVIAPPGQRLEPGLRRPRPSSSPRSSPRRAPSARRTARACRRGRGETGPVRPRRRTPASSATEPGGDGHRRDPRPAGRARNARPQIGRSSGRSSSRIACSRLRDLRPGRQEFSKDAGGGVRRGRSRRRGPRVRRPVAPAALRHGLARQHRRDPARVLKPRAAYVAALSGHCRRLPQYRVDPGRRWSGCGWTVPRSGRILRTSGASCRSRSGPQPALPARLRLVAPVGRRGRRLRDRVGGRLVAAAGTHVISHEARLAVVGNVTQTVTAAAGSP